MFLWKNPEKPSFMTERDRGVDRRPPKPFCSVQKERVSVPVPTFRVKNSLAHEASDDDISPVRRRSRGGRNRRGGRGRERERGFIEAAECYNCRSKSGHYARDCPTSLPKKPVTGVQQISQAQTSIYHKKDGEDHFARDCQTLESKKPGSCFQCGERGHQSRYCPDRPKQWGFASKTVLASANSKLLGYSFGLPERETNGTYSPSMKDACRGVSPPRSVYGCPNTDYYHLNKKDEPKTSVEWLSNKINAVFDPLSKDGQDDTLKSQSPMPIAHHSTNVESAIGSSIASASAASASQHGKTQFGYLFSPQRNPQAQKVVHREPQMMRQPFSHRGFFETKPTEREVTPIPQMVKEESSYQTIETRRKIISSSGQECEEWTMIRFPTTLPPGVKVITAHMLPTPH